MGDEMIRTSMMENFLKITLDRLSRTLECDLETVNKLKPIESSDFKSKNPEEDVTIVCNGYQMIMREFVYVDVGMVKWLPNDFFPEITPKIRIQYPKFDIDESSILSAKSLSALADVNLMNNTQINIFGDRTESWLVHFCVYERFIDVYSKYCEDPDEGCRVKDFTVAEIKTYNSRYRIENYCCVTEADRRVMCHLILLSGSQVMTIADHTLAVWVDDQKRAAFASFRGKSGQFPWDKNGFRGIRGALEIRPKLKQLLYSFCVTLRKDYPEMDLTLRMLARVEMGNLYVERFISAKKKAMSTLHPVIIEELEAYLNDLGTDQRKSWTDRMVFEKYPNLTAAAKHYLEDFDPAVLLKL